MALSLNDIKKKRAPLPPKSGAPKRAVMPWQDRDAAIGDIKDVEKNLTLKDQAASEADAKGHAEVAAEADAKGHAEVAAEEGAKGHAEVAAEEGAKGHAEVAAEEGAKGHAEVAAEEGAKGQAEVAAEEGAKGHAEVAAEEGAKGQAEVAAEEGAKGQAEVAAEEGAKGQAEVAAEEGAKGQAEVAAEEGAKGHAEVASKADAKGHAEVASEADAKGHAEVASEVDAKGHARKNPKRMLSKDFARNLSEKCKYNLVANSWIKVISEICKLCIENESLKTDKISYDYLADRTDVNAESLRRIIRSLEAEKILIFSKEYFQTGSRGRLFEISAQAMLCMLTHDVSLKKWVARQGIAVSEIKKFYDFK